jgi:hypothetical protein
LFLGLYLEKQTCVLFVSENSKTGIFLCPPPSKKGGHIALLLSVGRLVHQQFPFIFFALDAHIEMKFDTQIFMEISWSSSVWGTIKPFWTELWPLDVENKGLCTL